MSDYLWDGSGEPDPEVQKLESVLSQLRHHRPAPVFPEFKASQERSRRPWLLGMRWVRMAEVAAAVLVIAALVVVWQRSKPAPAAWSGWDLTRLEGPQTKVAGESAKLPFGQVLETDSRSQATIRAEEVGEIDLEPGTRLRLLKSSAGVKRLVLDRGTIHATIWAPAGQFVVDTPSALAVDLGCTYTLHVDGSGNGLLRTTLGWVGFKLNDHESFIPAGAACSTKPKTGPGTPYFEDASDTFRTALSRFDLASGTADERAAALQVVLAQARARDALTLWHLLSRVSGSERSRVYDRLSQLVAAPAGVTREGILRLDTDMLDLWWNELGLGDISVWRHWERSWSGQEKTRE